LSRVEYKKEQIRETPKNTGCMKNMENSSTAVKYVKFTTG
jgi:hypothetical protein